MSRLLRCLDEQGGSHALCSLVVDLARNLFRAQSVVAFRRIQGHLEAVAWHTPHGDRLTAWQLLGLREPLLEADRLATRTQAVEAENALFPGEEVAAVAPMGDGLLYLSPEPPELAQFDLVLFEWLALQAGKALGMAAARQDLEQCRDERDQLLLSMEGITRILEELPRLTATLDEKELVEQLGQHLETLIPHDSRAVLLLDPDGRLRVESVGFDPAGLAEPHQTLVEGRRPLRIDRLRGTRWEKDLAGHSSLMAVPIPGRHDLLGTIFLGSCCPEAFTAEHVRLLSIVANQFGVTVTNAQLHSEVLEAYEQLRDTRVRQLESSKLAAVGQLAAGVAHELNNPLGTILLATELLPDIIHSHPEKAERLLSNAGKAALRSKSIVEKLLVYSREREALRRAELSQVVGDALDLMETQLQIEGIRLLRRFDSQPLELVCNPGELQQVVTNLVLNAKAAILEHPDARREIEVCTGRQDQLLCFSVRDWGPGVASELSERIYEPFFTTRPVGKGTGLGLSICQRIVEEHCGRLELDCPGDGGARFWVRLGLQTPKLSETSS